MSNCAFGVYGTLVKVEEDGVLLMGSRKTTTASVLGKIVADDVLIAYLQQETYEDMILFGQRVADVSPLRSPHPENTKITEEERIPITKLIYHCPEHISCRKAKIEPEEFYYFCHQFYNYDFAYETEECAKTFVRLLEIGEVEIYIIPWEESLEKRVEIIRNVLQSGLRKSRIFKKHYLSGDWEYVPFQTMNWECKIIAPIGIFPVMRENVIITIYDKREALKYKFKLCNVFNGFSSPYIDKDDKLPEGLQKNLVQYILWKASKYTKPCDKDFIGPHISHIEKPHHSRLKRFMAFVKIICRMAPSILHSKK